MSFHRLMYILKGGIRMIEFFVFVLFFWFLVFCFFLFVFRQTEIEIQSEGLIPP